MAGLYRADLWAQSTRYVEVWAESRSIAAVIQDTCEELAVSLYPAGGYSSLTLTYEAAANIKMQAAERNGATIYYIVDYDPAGVLIDRSIETDLREHLGRVDLQFVRLGITEAQIEAFDLPTKPRKEGDRRARHIAHTVEAEAMPAYILRGLLREAVERHLPEGAIEAVRVSEQSEREGLLRMAAAMGAA